MRNLILFFSVLLLSAEAQSQNIKGTITGAEKKLPYASISVKGSSIGTSADEDGNYILEDVKPGEYTLEAEFVGFAKQKRRVNVEAGKDLIVNFNLKGDDVLDEISITGTLKPVLKSESPVPVEIYTSQFFKMNPTPSLFETLQLINGVQPQLNCNACNTGDIHINGMEGPYTMVLIDGMPIVSSLATVYGLSGIPTSMIERIEVVKGPASSLYGTEAMGGIINVITKDPKHAASLFLDAYTTSWLETNLDVATKFKVGEKANSLLGVNYFKYGNIQDKNKDGFTDVTLQDRVSVFNKWTFDRPEDRKADFVLRYVYEDRWGGETDWDRKKHRGGDVKYAESIFTNRIEALGIYQLPIEEKIFTQFSYNFHNQNSMYGEESYMAKQQVVFGQAYWDKEIENHSLLLGASFKYTYYDDDTSGTGVYNYEEEEKLDLIENAPMKSPIPGIFIQDEWTLNKEHKLLLGYRFDYDQKHKAIHSPRLAYKFTPTPNQALRASFGTGFRVVNVFTEDHRALTGARKVKFANELDPEKSYNGNLNYTWKVPADFATFNFDVTGFYTYFTNKIDADSETDSNYIIYDNLDGHAVSNGVSLNVDVALEIPLKLMIGASYMNVYREEKNEDGKKEKTDLFYSPKWTGNFLANYNFGSGFSADLTADVKGPMHLPTVEDDYRPDMSPWVTIANIQLTKQFQNGLEIYGGVKNIFNTTIKVDPISRWWDPYGEPGNGVVPPTGRADVEFEPDYGYTSMQGVRGFLGVRYTIL